MAHCSNCDITIPFNEEKCFFCIGIKDAELINLGNDKFSSLNEINRALRLEQLLKKRLKNVGSIDMEDIRINGLPKNHSNFVTEMELQSLVNESENS